MIDNKWVSKGKVHDAVLEIDGKSIRLRAPQKWGDTDWTII